MKRYRTKEVAIRKIRVQCSEFVIVKCQIVEREDIRRGYCHQETSQGRVSAHLSVGVVENM